MKQSAESKPSDRQEQHVVKRRRIRCGNCVGCLAPDCKNCRFCHDMKRYGGPGRLRKPAVIAIVFQIMKVRVTNILHYY